MSCISSFTSRSSLVKTSKGRFHSSGCQPKTAQRGVGGVSRPRRLNLTHLAENPRTIDDRNYILSKMRVFDWLMSMHIYQINPNHTSMSSASNLRVTNKCRHNKCVHPVTRYESVPHRTFSPPLLLARPPFRRFRYLGIRGRSATVMATVSLDNHPGFTVKSTRLKMQHGNGVAYFLRL